MKLWKITIHKGVSYYVVSKSSDEAYSKVREFLDEKDYFFTDDRDLEEIKVVATDKNYDAFPMLFL